MSSIHQEISALRASLKSTLDLARILEDRIRIMNLSLDKIESSIDSGNKPEGDISLHEKNDIKNHDHGGMDLDYRGKDRIYSEWPHWIR